MASDALDRFLWGNDPRRAELRRQAANQRRGISNPGATVPSNSGFEGGSVRVNNSAGDPVPVDTELPPASPLADLDPNPTTSRIGANMLGWDSPSGKWQRIGCSTPGNALGDGLSNTFPHALLGAITFPYLFNGTTWDRARISALTDTDSAATLVQSLGARLMSYDHVADKFLRVHGNSHGGIYVNEQMPSKAIGRTKVEYNDVRTTSGTLLTMTTGTDFHLVDLLISGSNTSVSASTRFRLRDGGATGPIRYEFVHATAGVGTPEHFNQAHTYTEHPVYDTSVYLEIVSGTLTVALNLHGYEASH